MPTKDELLEAAAELEKNAQARDGETALRLRTVAKWLREQAEEIGDVSVG